MTDGVPIESDDFEQTWRGCTRCHLGPLRANRLIVNAERRVDVPLQALVPVTETRGFLFVGEPAGESEEATGKTGVHSKYNAIHMVMKAHPHIPYAFTHSLACRCCMLSLDGSQQPRKDRYGVHFVRDVEPQKVSVDACRERLLQEIYRRDPFLIVALGSAAMKALNPRVTDLHPGKMYQVPVEGELRIPARTPKGTWGRKVQGAIQHPLRKNTVLYRALLTPSMSEVQTYGASNDVDREKMVFVRCMQTAVSMWAFKTEMENT